MARYVLSRLVQAVVTMWFIALVTFLLMHAVPGGPFERLAGDRAVSPAFIRQQESYYGLDDPLPQQFVRYMGNLLQGDLGISFALQGQSVGDRLLDGAWPSLLLGLMAFAIVVAVGFPLGVLGAARRGAIGDGLSLGVSTILGAVPSFVLAFLLLIVFSVWLDLFDVRLGRDFGSSLGTLQNGLVPALALAAPAVALLSRHVRSALLEVLDADYVRTARAKGLPTRAIYGRHALRNALLPALTLSAPLLADLVTGSVIVETIFGLPGIGSAFVDSIGQRDYGMIMGTTLLYGTVIVLLNLAVDLTYPLIDPRVRLSR